MSDILYSNSFDNMEKPNYYYTTEYKNKIELKNKEA